MPTHRSAKLATAATVAAAGLTLATGLAVAGVLPDQASDTAEEKVAENRPATTTTAPTTTTTSATTGAPGAESHGDGDRPTDTHGYAVSGLATSTDLEGRDKGEAISDLASSNAQSGGAATTGTVTAQAHQPAERGKSAEHRP